MKIAVCDDETVFLNQISKYMSELKSEIGDIEWNEFDSGNDLIAYYQTNSNAFDIVILDIEMPGINGVDVANKIRECDNSVIIFFLTSHTEHMIDCFRSSPMNFWLKPPQYSIIREDLLLAKERSRKQRQTISIRSEREWVRIKCNDIIYLEASGHKTEIHTIEKTYITNTPIIKLLELLDEATFAQISKACVINLFYLKTLSNSKIELYNIQDVLSLSRGYKSELKDKFIEYKEKR